MNKLLLITAGSVLAVFAGSGVMAGDYTTASQETAVTQLGIAVEATDAKMKTTLINLGTNVQTADDITDYTEVQLSSNNLGAATLKSGSVETSGGQQVYIAAVEMQQGSGCAEAAHLTAFITKGSDVVTATNQLTGATSDDVGCRNALCPITIVPGAGNSFNVVLGTELSPCSSDASNTEWTLPYVAGETCAAFDKAVQAAVAGGAAGTSYAETACALLDGGKMYASGYTAP